VRAPSPGTTLHNCTRMISRRRRADRLSLRRHHGGSFAAGKRQRYVRSLRPDNAWAMAFLRSSKIAFGGNFGGIGEQLVKVVWSSSILAMPFFRASSVRLRHQDWRLDSPSGQWEGNLSRGTPNCSTISWGVGVLDYFLAETLLLHFRYLASIRRADSEG
jgi:hypothetical protein